MSELKLSIVTPESKLLEVECVQVNLPGSEGFLGVLAGHMNLISSLKPGVLEYFQGSDLKPKMIAISDGFVEISHSDCVVLVERAVMPGSMDVDEVLRKIAELEAALQHEQSEREISIIEKSLEYYKSIKSL